MQLSKAIFWDTNIKEVSYDKDNRFIIPRVFMRGTYDDLIQVMRYYGKAHCKEVLTQTRYLDKKTLAFCCAIFQLQKEDFRCYRLSRSKPTHWHY